MVIHKQTNILFWIAAISIIIGAILYCSWPLGFWLNPAATRTGLASELGAVGQPYSWFFIWADIVSGILLCAGCALLLYLFKSKLWVKECVITLALYGIFGALDAALPERCVPSLQVCGPIFHDPQLILHGIFDILGTIALFVTLIVAWLHVRIHKRTWQPLIYVISLLGLVFALLSFVFLVWGGPSYWAQRYYLTLSSVWVGVLPFVLRDSKDAATIVST